MTNTSKPRVAILTPTFKRSIEILDRCIRTVQYQTYGIDNITHFICHDGPDIEQQKIFKEYFAKNSWIKNTVYIQLDAFTGTYGAGVRQYLLDAEVNDTYSYVLHLDDDNVIFPEFVETHVNCLEGNPNKHFSICQILHLGPLPSNLGRPPAIIDGIPPVYRNIDTLQVMIRAKSMKGCGWIQKTGIDGYCNDGYTYEKLGKMFEWIAVPKLLAVHI